MQELIIGLFIGLGVGGLVYFLVIKNKNALDPEKISELLNIKIKESYKDIIDLTTSMTKDKLTAEKSEIKTDLENKKTAIEDLVKRTLDELKSNQKKMEEVEKNTVGSFSAVREQLDGQHKLTEELRVTTNALKNVLSNNQMRGQFGEQVADNLLKMAGFVNDVDYVFNTKQAGSQTRPDFTIFLPDGARINVDAKFPYQNLQKAAETDDPGAKKSYMAEFESDIKKKIKQVTTRDYINPEDNTVDFVILFVPNEMIFSYIYDKMNLVWADAMDQKVVLAGPFNFTAVLRLIKQAYNNFKYQKNIVGIINNIKTFEKEFTSYNEEFEKIGTRIAALSDQYTKVDTTRTRQLLRTVEKIKLEEESAKSDKLLG